MTVPNSENANLVLKNALDSGDLYQIGIAIHAFADSWSHQNFLGFKNKGNARNVLDWIPNIGHADFRHEPDKVHNEWKDPRLGEGAAVVNNDDRFMEAAKQIFIHLYKSKNPESDADSAVAEYIKLDLENQLREAMKESYLLSSDSKARIESYKNICEELDSEDYLYDPKKWRHAAVKKEEVEFDIFDRYWAKDDFEDSDWFKFQKAVINYREYALDKFHNLFDKVGFI